MKQQLLILATLLFAFLAPAAAQTEFLPDAQTRILLTDAQVQALPNEVKTRLHQTAFQLAQIWGDTILEGDFYADEDVQIDSVEKVYLSQAFVAYRITYSSQAWNTSDCQFQSDDLGTLNQCLAGRIVESGFVSSDFKSLSRDPEAFAKFRKN